MCRLLGWATATPATLTDLVGERDLAGFTALSGVHGDGWGCAWRRGDEAGIRTEPEAASGSAAFAAATRGLVSDLGLVHLRQASLGLAVTPENTHPFTDGGLAFAHNGSIAPPSSLEPLVDDVTALRGQTDSERYFRAVLARAEHLPVRDALTSTVAEVAETCGYTSLNCLLMTPEWLYAVCWYDRDAELCQTDQEYFSLRYRISPGVVVVGSSGWGRGWRELGNGEVLAVRRGTLEVSLGAVNQLALAC